MPNVRNCLPNAGKDKPVRSAGQSVTGSKRGKRVIGPKRGKKCRRFQAREKAKSVPSAGKRVASTQQEILCKFQTQENVFYSLKLF